MFFAVLQKLQITSFSISERKNCKSTDTEKKVPSTQLWILTSKEPEFNTLKGHRKLIHS